ncbi:hypothetical protein AB0L57_19755 [Nocardia sp. NPDC052254]|uniref:hypothetical protein n=1 Tax=Nocardia sp. NPDC052254 TaxID=3155681 RepID=UPI0034234E18
MKGSVPARALLDARHGSALGAAIVAGVVSVSVVATLPALARTTTGTRWPRWFDVVSSHVRELGAALLADLADPVFYGTAAAGLLMLAGGAFAHAIRDRNVAWRGFAVACGSGLWAWMVTSGLLALVLSHIAWGWTRSADIPWQPLFVPFVSVSPAVVLMYGKGWRVALTAAILGAGLTTPAAIATAAFVCTPLRIPQVAGFTAAMAVTAYTSFAVCHRLPWLATRSRTYANEARPDGRSTVPSPGPQSATWILRRVLADFTEAPFFGNEWAGAGLIVGAVLAYLAIHPSEGIPALFPQILGAQLVAGTLSVIVWRGRWRVHGWYPSFVPIVSVAPAAVIAFSAAPIPTGIALVLGVLAGPPLAFRLGDLLPRHVHRFVGCVGSMAICAATIVPAIGLFL